MHYIWLFFHWYLIGVLVAELTCMALVTVADAAGMDTKSYPKEDKDNVLYAPFLSWLFIIIILGLIIEVKKDH